MGYREDWFRHNKPNIFGKYRCIGCGRYFPESKIEIDHRIPKRRGGTDDIWNLQPMCRSCNRSKSAKTSAKSTFGTLVRATANGDLDKALGNIAARNVKDALGIKYKRK